MPKILTAVAVLFGLLVGTFTTWTVDRKYSRPVGCGGCSYVQYLGELATAVRDVCAHIFTPSQEVR